jgi:hypothetical protein
VRTIGLLGGPCSDAANVFAAYSGRARVAKTFAGETVAALHARCEGSWADKNCETWAPLKKKRQLRKDARRLVSGSPIEPPPPQPDEPTPRPPRPSMPPEGPEEPRLPPPDPDPLPNPLPGPMNPGWSVSAATAGSR